MRILVHDYAGHPFQVQLSRRLAARGHDVLHLYCGSTHTPRGELARRADDPPTFDICDISLSEQIPKTNFVRRYRLESQYADMLVAAGDSFRPEVVISANTPSIAQYRLARGCRRQGVRLVSWIQDIYGVAAYRLLSRKLPVVGHAVGKYFIALDRWSARTSDAVVVITNDFRGVLTEWGIDPARVHVIHNWAPLDALPTRPRENDWSRALGLDDGLRFIYSGTLAMKHNPALLLELARLLETRSLGQLIVISEGEGVRWLAEQAAATQLKSLKCLPFQPFEAMADVLGSADVLVAILEADAGVFSVPSKVLSYLCAGRPLLLAVPKENLAAKIVVECEAGEVVEPTDVAGFCAAARKLAESPQLRQSQGVAARRYAEANFDIERITDRFEAILLGS
ncbi:MAG TPA: glycosyltransferase family 4 protein [Lacipirellulaceae bacterium]|jgi:glycosyltransferase involved in cell wall biosynthesis